MNNKIRSLFRILCNILFGVRRNTKKCVIRIASRTNGKKILEIGSGKKVRGKYIYSYASFFSRNNDFSSSDINPSFGHQVIDITNFRKSNQYDLILCLNVLEHVFEYSKAITNLYNALKKGGTLALFVPYIYPLHDEPYDYFRYSDYALRKMLRKFRKVDVKIFGLREFPFAYFVEAKK